jgi:hypothetical protein
MAGETGRGESGVDKRFLYDGPFEPPLYRIRPAPPKKILALRASRAAVLAAHARGRFEIALERAAKRGGLPQEPERDDRPEVRVDARRIAEILAPYRRAFDAMGPDEQELFLATIRLFAAERISPREWRAVAKAAEDRYWATLPPPEPPGGRVKAKDRPSHPPQGW